MALKALIFDVDGTLSETEDVHRQAFNETFAEHGIDWYWSREDYAWLLRTTGGKERMKVWRDSLKQSVPSVETIAALHAEKTRRFADIVAEGGLSLRPGVRELIAEARTRGLRLAVATTTNRPNVDALCRCCWGVPAAEVFDVLAAGDEVPRKKPAPDVFLLALQRLKLSAEECVAFEDSRNGVISAVRAGLRVIATPSTYTQSEDVSEASAVLDALSSEILSAIV
jgi:haloacid dehalogenase superfamily, subfamily IA, variant 3 with third motif having DD or ED